MHTKNHENDNSKFIHKFRCNVEPVEASMQVCDLYVDYDMKQCKVALNLDGGFMIGTSNHERYQALDKQVTSHDTKPNYIKSEFIQAFSSKWPYLTYADLDNQHLIIINIYDFEIIHRIKIPGNPTSILKTFITATNDLIFVVQNEKNTESPKQI